MTTRALRRLVALVGFLAGGSVGAAAFWAIGYYGWVDPIRHPIVDLLAFVTVLVLPMSLVAPLALVRYLGRNLRGTQRWGVTLAGYALLVGFTFVLAYLELFQTLGITTAVEAMAFFAAVFGATFGGIVGSKLAVQSADRRVTTEWVDESNNGWDR